MSRFLLRLVVAVVFAVIVNGALAIGMAFWADLGSPPRRPAPERRPVEIPFVKTQPPKKKTVAPRRRPVQAKVARTPLPALNLPSAISVPIFDTDDLRVEQVVHPTRKGRSFVLGEETVLTEEMLDEPPRPLTKAPLLYPKVAERQGVEGVVEVRLLLAADGSVSQVKILSATPPGIFEAAARKSLLQWRFTPATFRGQRLSAWVRQRVVFKLH